MKKYRWSLKLFSFLFVLIFIFSINQSIAQSENTKARYIEIRSQTSISEARVATNNNLGVTKATSIFVNGGFETGDFTGWEYGEEGEGLNPWAVCRAFEPSPECGWFMNNEPEEGMFDALNGFDGEEGYTAYLGQKILIPEVIPEEGFAISYWDRIQYDGYEIPSKLPRVYEVCLMQNEQVLEVLHHQEIMLNGQPQTDLGWQQRIFDLSKYAGQPVVFRISLYVPEFYTGPAQIEFDDFTIGTPQPPPSGCDLTPVLRALEVVEAKLDSLGKLPEIIDILYKDVSRLQEAVDKLEAKIDMVEAKIDRIEATLNEGEVVTQSDLADGQGGVWFPAAKKVTRPPGPTSTP